MSAGPTTPTGDLRSLLRLWPALRAHRRRFVQAVAASLCVQIGTIGVAVTCAVLAGTAVGAAGVGAPSWFPAAVAVGAGLVGLAAAGVWWEMFVAHDLAYLVLADLRVAVFDALRRSLPARSDRRRSGDVAAVAMSDVESLEWVYAHVVAQVSVAAVTIGAGTAALAVVDPVLVAVVVPAAVAVCSVPWWARRGAARDGAELRAAVAGYSGEVVDTVQGLPELAAAGALERRLDRLDVAARRVDRAAVAGARRGAVEQAAGDAVVSGSAIAALVVLSGHIVSGALPVAAAPVAVALMGAVLAPAAQVAGTLKELGGLRAAATRLFGVLDLPAAVAEPVRPTPAGRPRAGVPVLEVAGVDFAYTPGRPVLRGVGLRVWPGETVALTGPSGVGKSTLIALLQRFWDPDRGTIALDGVPLDRLSEADLRSGIAVVEQEPRLFAGTLAENLRLGAPEADDEELLWAVGIAQLDEVVAGLPRGLDTDVSERGARLSGGQRARVALARALLVRPRLVVLDESTAALDAAVEADLHRALAAWPDRPAMLVISHRASTVERADRVVTLGGAQSCPS